MSKILVENLDEENNQKPFAQKEIINEQKTDHLEKLYQNNELKQIQKPPRVSWRIIFTAIVISLILGFLLGFLSAFYLLQKEENQIFPWQKINLEKLLP